MAAASVTSIGSRPSICRLGCDCVSRQTLHRSQHLSRVTRQRIDASISAPIKAQRRRINSGDLFCFFYPRIVQAQIKQRAPPKERPEPRCHDQPPCGCFCVCPLATMRALMRAGHMRAPIQHRHISKAYASINTQAFSLSSSFSSSTTPPPLLVHCVSFE